MALVAAVAMAAGVAGAAAAQGHAHHASPPAEAAAPRFARTVAEYEVPEVELVDAAGRPVALAELLAGEGPVMLQFVFTTCPGVCPALSGLFAATEDRLAAAGGPLAEVRLVSISIDPEHDTPERLADYARRFRAGPRWTLLTGRRDDVLAVQRAFDADRGSKMRHEPTTYLSPGGGEWVRLDGFPTPDELVAEARRVVETGAAGGVSVQPAAEAPYDPGLIEIGRRLYQDGVRPSGRPLSGIALGGAPMAGSCASCHRPSGFGTLEGGAAVPAVTGEALFGDGMERRADLFRRLYLEPGPPGLVAAARAEGARPAYTAESLGAALREGVDPAGRPLDPLMPRYTLDEGEVAALAAYLARLGAGPEPGVDDEAIHFATVVAPGVDPARRRDHLGVLAAYAARHDRDVAQLLARPGASPHHRDDFAVGYRRWRLHVWELAGPPEGWRAQLETVYAARPVFALLGGLGAGDWRPVHDFCEATAVPCLFPQVPLPPPEAGDWALYLDHGVAGEAAALARALAADGRPPGTVVQVWRQGDEVGEAAATAFRAALPQALVARLLDRPLAAGAEADADVWRRMAGPHGTVTLVLWLDRWPPSLPAHLASRLAAVHLSHRLLGDALPAPPPALAEKVRLTWPYALPAAAAPHSYRVRAWLRSRRVPPGDERLQLATWWTAAVVDHALAHMVDRFDRAWLVERVEHEAELVMDPGVYPAPALGPGQRFASKGVWIVRLDPAAPGGVAAVGEWRRVPEAPAEERSGR